MIRLFKWFMISAFALIVLLVVTLAVGITFFDPNMLKATFVKKIESRIGGTLTVGNISIMPTPVIRLTLNAVSWIQQPHEGEQNTIKLDAVVIGIPFYQLIGDGSIDATLQLKHPVIHVNQAKLDTLTPEETTKTTAISEASFQTRLTERITLSTLIIENGSFAFDREQGKIALHDVALKVGPLSMSTPKKQEVDITFSGTMAEGPVRGKIGIDGAIAIDLGAHAFKLDQAKITVDESTFTLSLDAAGDFTKMKTIPKALGQLAKKSGSPSAGETIETQTDTPAEEGARLTQGALPFALFNTLNKQTLSVTIRDDTFTVSPISIEGFGGTASVSAKFIGLSDIPQGEFDLTLKNLDAKSLQALSSNAKAGILLSAIEGPLNATVHLNGRGKENAEFKASLTGTMTADLNALAFPHHHARLDQVHAIASLDHGAIVFSPLTFQKIVFGAPAILLSDVTLQGTLADERLSLSKLNAGFLGGTLSLSGTLTKTEGETSLALHATGEALNLADLPKKPENGDTHKAQGGILSMSVDVKGSGNTPDEIRHGMHVSGTFTIRDFPLPPMAANKQQGPKITQMIPALRAKAEAMHAQMEKIMGSRRLNHLKGHIEYNGGDIALSDTDGSSENYDVSLNGTISREKTLNFRGTVVLTETSSEEIIASNDMAKLLLESDGRMHIPFTVTGDANNPHRSLDLSALKDKVKNEIKPSDVRKAIEQRFPNAPRPGQGRGRQLLQNILQK